VRYVVPRASHDTEDGEIVVFHFGAEELGRIEATLDRWGQEFSGVEPGGVTRANRQVNGVRLHTIQIARGTFDSAGPSPNGTKRTDYALEGAIAEGPSSAYLFKMTGPARTIAAGRPAFAELLDSLRLVRPER
jgi:hypothetical protein